MSFKEIQKKRLKGTIRSITEKLENLEVEDIVKDTFVYTEDEFSRELLNKYEKQLYLAKLRPDEFSKGIYRFFQDTAKFIKENRQISRFYEFCYFIYSELKLKEDLNKDILFAYQDLLIQQMTHFYNERVIYGIDNNGNALIANEVYPKFDYALMELEKKFSRKDLIRMGQEKVYKILGKLYKKYGYNINSEEHEDIKYILEEQGITREMFQLTPFIGESTMDIHAEPYFLDFIHGIDIREINIDREELKEKIRQRRKSVLPFEGLIAKINNCGIIDRVLFKERIYNNKLFLLFKIKTLNREYTSGFCEIDRGVEFTVWSESSGEVFHNNVLNLIIAIYYMVVFGERQIEDVRDIEIVNDFDEQKDNIEVILLEKVYSKEKGESEKRYKNMEEYLVDKSEISCFVRKLPEGQVASKEAMERARKVGYILKEGETFVSPHKKRVYRKKENKGGK